MLVALKNVARCGCGRFDRSRDRDARQHVPATATRVQSNLGIRRGAAFDVQAVCAGYVYALTMADNMIRSVRRRRRLSLARKSLAVFSIGKTAARVFFGDGAGACVLATETAGTNADTGILSTHIHSDGEYYDMLYVDGGLRPRHVGLSADGRQGSLRHAVQRMSEVTAALDQNNLAVDQLDWLIPHQANKRIMDSIAKKLNLPDEKIVVTVDRQANTSAATIPLALAEASADGRLKPGDLIALSALGGGFAWGSALLRL